MTGNFPPPPTGDWFGSEPNRPGAGASSRSPLSFGPGLAGFGPRFLASFLDGLILVVPSAIALVAIPLVASTEIAPCTIDGEAYLCEQMTDGWLVVFAFGVIAVIIAHVAYYTVMVGRSGATLGKRALGIKVVDINSEETIGMPRAFGRLLGQYVSGIPCYLGYLWMLWDDRSQTWHDKMVRSRVVID